MKIFCLCAAVHVAVGAESTLEALTVEERPVRGSDLEVSVVALMELFGMDALGPSHMTIELGASVGQDEQPYTQALTGGLELGLELTAPVHIESFNPTVRKECLRWVHYSARDLPQCQRGVEQVLGPLPLPPPTAEPRPTTPSQEMRLLTVGFLWVLLRRTRVSNGLVV